MRTKTCSYLTFYSDESEKAKETKTCDIKWKLTFEDYKHCLEAKISLFWIIKRIKRKIKRKLKEFIKNNKLILKSRQRFRIEK